MKKILSLGAAAAVLSLTAVAASAAIAPTMTPASPVAGDTVTVEIAANGMTQSYTSFKVVASENLTLTGNTPVTGALFNAETNRFAWAGTEIPADGTVLITLTYTVNAAADEEVSVSLVADDGMTDISADAVAAVVVDAAGGNVTDETAVVTTEAVTTEAVTTEVVTEPATTEPATTDENGLQTTEPATTEPATAEPQTPDDGKAEPNPGTGVALAVVPAVLAGAAIVVAKKRK